MTNETTKPVVTQAAYEAAQAVFDSIAGDAYNYAEYAKPSYREAAVRTLASAIEAAQIAARNDALEEVAKVFTDYQQRVKDGGSDTTVMWTAERAAYAIRTLLTPSQHQEEQ